MVKESMFQEAAVSAEGMVPAETGMNEELIPALSAEIQRFDSILKGVETEKIPPAGYLALTGAVIVNLICLINSPGTYMVLWILASLYFYLFYPLLPLFLFVIPTLIKARKTLPSEISHEQVIPRIKNLHLIRNHRIVIQLGIRFFIMSIMPLTSGMVLIYSISLIFGVILGITRVIPGLTSLLIIMQCMGILIFYLDLSFLKRQFTFMTRSLRMISGRNMVRYLFFAILGIILVIIASCAAIILLIAILLPGFTLGIYVDVTSLIQNRTNLWILLLLISQFIWMQCLQSILSRTLTRRFGMELRNRLKQAYMFLTGEESRENREDERMLSISAGNPGEMQKEVILLVIESRIHTVTRSHLAGLFPTYAIGINIQEILTIEEFKDLSAMFRHG